MKNKSWFIKSLIFIILLSSLVRIGNISFLTLGNYQQKNVYALNSLGAVLWNWIDAPVEYTEHEWIGETYGYSIIFENKYIISSDGHGIWNILGAFGIHNLKNVAEELKLSGHNCQVRVDGKYISFVNPWSIDEERVILAIEDGKVASYEERFEPLIMEHTETIDIMMQRAEEALVCYQNIMNQFTQAALIFEGFLLLLHAGAIICLLKWYRRVRDKALLEDGENIHTKHQNLRWWLISSLFYSFMIEGMICLFASEGRWDNLYLGMFLGWIPAYIVTFIILLVIYIIRRGLVRYSPISEDKHNRGKCDNNSM